MPQETVECDIDFSINDSPQSVVAFLKRISRIFDPSVRQWNIDFSKCRYLGPDAVAIVVASVLEARRSGIKCSVTLPKGVPALDAFCEFSGLNHLVLGTPIPQADHPDCV